MYEVLAYSMCVCTQAHNAQTHTHTHTHTHVCTYICMHTHGQTSYYTFLLYCKESFGWRDTWVFLTQKMGESGYAVVSFCSLPSPPPITLLHPCYQCVSTIAWFSLLVPHSLALPRPTSHLHFFIMTSLH